jgi:ribonucleoside-diphosphate reductase alpha chain
MQEELGIMTQAVRARKNAQDAASSIGSDTAGPARPAPAARVEPAVGPKVEPHLPVARPSSAQPAARGMTDSPPVRPARLVGLDLGPACNQCGGMMQRTGSCYTCSSCGNNTGCG